MYYPKLDFVQIQRASVRITDRLHQALQIDPRDFYQLGVAEPVNDFETLTIAIY